METERIIALLRPYDGELSPAQAQQISTYIEILLRWNAKMNLTSIREEANIVKRHFGEALFLARHLSERGLLPVGASVLDIGSGAGFPGIPLKIACPGIALTLVEAHRRKAVFLKEVLRAIHLDALVNNARAEQLVRSEAETADIVTFRAVEKFESILPLAARFVRLGGTLALLIGREQVSTAQNLLRTWQFSPLLLIPGSENRGIMLLNQSS